MDKTVDLSSDSISDSFFSNLSLPESSTRPETKPSTSSERATSPILNRSRIRSRVKSKVKLLDKFTKNETSNKNISGQIEKELNTSFDLTPEERLAKLKQLEETKRRLASPLYNALMEPKSEHNFKKPISPAPNRKRTSQIACNSPQVQSKIQKTHIECISQVEFSKLQGFQTGTGKSIDIPPEKLQKQIGLFDGILSFEDLNETSNDNSACQKVLDSNQLSEILRGSISDTQLNFATDIALLFDEKSESCIDDVEEQENAGDKSEDCKGFLFENNLYEEVYKIIIECFENSVILSKKLGSSKRKLANSTENLSKKFKSNNFPEVGGGKMQSNNTNAVALIGFSTAAGNNIEISNEALKKANSMLDSQNLTNFSKKVSESKSNTLLSNMSGKGFATAAGNTIKISNEALRKASSMLDEENLPLFSKKLSENIKSTSSFNNSPTCRFATAGGNSIQISNEALKKANKFLDESNFPHCSKNEPLCEKIIPSCNITSTVGFSTAGGNSIKISNEALKKAGSMLDEENLPSFSKKVHENIKIASSFNNSSGFATAGGNCIQISNEALKKANTLLDDNNLIRCSKKLPVSENINPSFNRTATVGCSTAGGNCIKISNEALRKAGSILNEENLPSFSKKLPSSSSGFATAGGKGIQISSHALQNANNFLMESNLPPICTSNKELTDCDLESLDESMFNLSHNTVEQFSATFTAETDKSNPEVSLTAAAKSTSSKAHINTQFMSPLRNLTSTPGRSRKTLGVSISKQIPISKQNLQRAMQLFEEPEMNNKPVLSNTIYSSTPIKNNAASRPTNVSVEKNNRTALFSDAYITPIKHPKCEEIIPQYQLIKELDSKIIVKRESSSQTLETQLEILHARIHALESQKHLTQSGNLVQNSPMLGVLLRRKSTAEKITWKDFLGSEKPGSITIAEAIKSNVSVPVTTIAPSNSELVNFNCNAEETGSLICTQDGAIVIPNLSNLVGVQEISNAFKVMCGVDPKLIPQGWIANHFKWIVWKLASLERNFPSKFSNYLSVETVVQQLKYRYDREIDKAERPALRKILEKDDTPIKRLVLCVADIIQSSLDTYELELTDGWYSIRTSIDTALTKQIQSHKIVVGTKLITQYAELLNCDGCHPLQVSDMVRLKITYNCTRRAAWYSKLGYQKVGAPFPIYMKTIMPEGGLVGRIKVYIARMYLIKYLEKEPSGRTIWRNKKAEDKRAEQWERDRLKAVEMVQHKIQREFEVEVNDIQTNKPFAGNVSEITSPQVLYQMLENTNDPEGLQNLLSPAQLNSAMSYKMNIGMQRQQELSSRLSEELKTLKLTPRNVTPVLSLKVTDALGSQQSRLGCVLNIYKPAEDLLQSLVEGSTFSVFNVLPKHNGELSSNSRTHFKLEAKAVANDLLQRRPIPVSSIKKLENPIFNEYDTYGTVVRVNKTQQAEDVWLTDFSGSLLLVKIVGGADRCSLSDNLSQGKNVAILNLIFTRYKKDVAQAIANQGTVITSYPQQSLLQEKFTEYCKGLPKDVTLLLEECDMKIDGYLSTKSGNESYSNMSIKNVSTNISNLFDDCDDSTLIPSELTTTDIAMSLIDTDQYLES